MGDNVKQVLIIGAGAAGLMAAATAAEAGAQVTVLEKMNAPGRKLLITGKGRCNITNACDIPELIKICLATDDSCIASTEHLIIMILLLG